MSTTTLPPFDSSIKPISTAKLLSSSSRKAIGIQAAAKATPIVKLANENGTSRKFIYQQKKVAENALENAFEKQEKESDVLFHLPVTKTWLHQFIISLVLICRCSYRGVVEILRDQLDYKISVGTVHNIIQKTIEKVKVLHEDENLSGIRVGAPDEIFQSGNPVLAACDVESMYCYLLKQAEHRDGDTWAIHLMECQDKGLNLEYTIADFGKGLRAGQREAMPDIPCLGDHFHVLYDMGKARIYLDNRVFSTIKASDSLEKKMSKAKAKGKGNKFSKKLAASRAESAAALKLADDFGILTDWMQEILLPIGPDFRTRQEMFDFIVDELKKMEVERGKHRIIPIRRLLENNKEKILHFALLIDEQWKFFSEELGINDYLLRKMYEFQRFSVDAPQKRRLEQMLRQRLGGKYHFVSEAVSQIQLQVMRASSAVENFNSRLRNYFFLRKHLGMDYLDLLRFFLNERCFLASEDPRRSKKSPAELMTGMKRPHWLEQLGYQLFNRAA